MEKIKIVIVDDSYETRNNLKQLLSFDRRFEVIGEAENGEEAIFIVKDDGYQHAGIGWDKSYGRDNDECA